MEALRNFRLGLKNLQETGTGQVLFQAQVEYHIGGRNFFLSVPVSIDLLGRDAGKVVLQGAAIRPEEFHLEFTPQWQRYKYTPDDRLRIWGESPTHGRFELTIYERN